MRALRPDASRPGTRSRGRRAPRPFLLRRLPDDHAAETCRGDGEAEELRSTAKNAERRRESAEPRRPKEIETHQIGRAAAHSGASQAVEAASPFSLAGISP